MGIEKLSGIQENVPLAPLTTFRIGGPARYFYLAKAKEEIIEAIKVAREDNLPFFILGGGSNLLVADKGFDGLVLKVQNSKIKVRNEMIEAEGGATLGEVVAASLKAGWLAGLEWAAGIPGTVGGAVCGNASAYGHRTSELVLGVKILDEKGRVRILSNRDCRFGYHESIFKRKPWVILEVNFGLRRGSREESQKLIHQYLEDRQRRIPPYPSAGSVFKNLEIRGLRSEVRGRIPEEKIKGGMIPTGYLIEQCGLKGKQIGGAKISDEHANIIVNLGGAKATDVVELINLAKKEVKEKFGIELEEEIQYLGF